MPNAGSVTIQMVKWAGRLNFMPEMNPQDEERAAADAEKAIVALDKLDLEAAKEAESVVDMSVVKAQALKAFGHWINKRGLPELLLTKAFQNLEQVEQAHKMASDIAKAKTTPKKIRLAAIEATNRTARTMQDMLKEIMELSKESSGKNAPTKRNVGAPDFANLNFTMINNTGTPTPGVPATDITEVRKEIHDAGPQL